jgi:hypothetical protein
MPESNSTKLSPPKANSAGLWECQDDPREIAASIVIHNIVNTWSLRTRPETSGEQVGLDAAI